MTVQITICSPDSEINRQLGYFIAHAREVDEEKHRRPRGLIKRLRDALKPDQVWWRHGGGNQWNNMPGIALHYVASTGPELSEHDASRSCRAR